MSQMIKNSELFKFKAKITGKNPKNDNTKNVEIVEFKNNEF